MKKRGYKIWRVLVAVGYFLCVAIIIIESCLNGQISSDHSDKVGGALANIVNDIGGDQTIAIEPTSLIIKNKIKEAQVGDNYQMEVETLPENVTYQATNYLSTNKEVATVSSSGLISFLKAGLVTIMAQNDYNQEIVDAMEVLVSNVELDDITCSINAEMDDNENYILYLDSEVDYYLSTAFLPSNTTFAQIEYDINPKNFLSINNDGLIIPLNYSHHEVTTITTKVGNIEKNLRVLVDTHAITHLTSIAVQDDVIYKTQTKAITIDYSPNNASFLDVELFSSNEDVVEIVDSHSYRGLKEGVSTILVSSLAYPSISCSFEVRVEKQPLLHDFTMEEEMELVVGRTAQIEITKTDPIYADTSNAVYRSKDEDLISAADDGIISALKEGVTTVSVEINGVIKEMIINVLPRIDDIDALSIEYDVNEPYIIRNQERIDLWSLLGEVKYYKNQEMVIPQNQDLTFISSDEQVAIVQQEELLIKSSGKIFLSIYHPSSGLFYKDYLPIVAIFSSQVAVDNEVKDLTLLTMNVQESLTLSILDSSENSDYQITIPSEMNGSLLIEKTDSHTFLLKALSKGEGTLSLDLSMDGQVYDRKIIKLAISHIYGESLYTTAFDYLKGEDIAIVDHHLTMYLNDEIGLKSSLSYNATIAEISYLSNNNDVLEIQPNGRLKAKKIGEATISIFDNAPLRDGLSSRAEDYLVITIYHRILLDYDHPFITKGMEYNSKSDEYTLMNGHSASLNMNFLEGTSFFEVHYSSSDEKIAKIGSDGTINPFKAGVTTITMTCNDGMSEPIEMTITLRVRPQKAIQDLSSFLSKVRKDIGHFGAFLVLGLFSTFFYFMIFSSKKQQWLAIVLNLFQGIGIAFLTEFIQTMVPGRYGTISDVILDSMGFLCSALILSIALFILKRKKLKEQHRIDDLSAK